MSISRISKQEIPQNINTPKKCNAFKKLGATVGGVGYALYDVLYEYPDVFKRHEKELLEKNLSFAKGVAIKVAAIAAVSGMFALIGTTVGACIDGLVNRHRSKKAEKENKQTETIESTPEPQKLLPAGKKEEIRLLEGRKEDIKLLNPAPAHYNLTLEKPAIDERYILSAPKEQKVLLLNAPAIEAEYRVIDSIPEEETLTEWEDEHPEVAD